MVEQLTVGTRTAGETVVLTFAGELDVTNAGQAEEAVRAAQAEHQWDSLVFDLSGLTFMDSTGVRVLVRAHRLAAQRGGTIALAGLTPSVSRIMEVTGLDRAFAIHATLGEALPAHSLSNGDDRRSG
ncbi:STAS domain-containing protein [Actinomadura sp. DC4]|uniref:STAS domain-containing protein n=1 Tax=Actinomadura sp. DC4 TaxID=3055069 RepID=UPI0025AFDD43|nr:STAS domain-containing protein [Actinomadura sp. DC4]MDN3354389.1 STAS domain-containing protein [Actinomadura sp. DC4]